MVAGRSSKGVSSANAEKPKSPSLHPKGSWPNKEATMKNELSPEQFSAAAPRREQLDALLSHAQACAQVVLREHGQLFPTLCALHVEGLGVYIANTPDEAEDASYPEDLRLICSALGATVAVLVLQVWARVVERGEPLGLQPRPSLCSDRKEYLSLIGTALGGIHANRLLPILRNRSGRFSGLDTAVSLAPKPVVARYASPLPQTPPTAEDRDIARRLLACRGLVINTGPLPQ